MFISIMGIKQHDELNIFHVLSDNYEIVQVLRGKELTTNTTVNAGNEKRKRSMLEMFMEEWEICEVIMH